MCLYYFYSGLWGVSVCALTELVRRFVIMPVMIKHFNTKHFTLSTFYSNLILKFCLLVMGKIQNDEDSVMLQLRST